MTAETDPDRRSEEPTDARDEDRLRGRIAVVEEENRRLRQEDLRARQSQYRRSAIGMAFVGAVALVGAAVLPALRRTLLILAATGGFGGVLLYFLTPDQLVPASVGEAAYTAYRSHATALRDELGLQEQSIYVPLDRTDETDAGVRLFVPQTTDWELPDEQSLQATFVSPNQERRRGVAFTPAAHQLWTAFVRGTSLIDDSPDRLPSQLAEAAVEQFELARTADAEADEPARRVSIVVEDVSYGVPTHFDHPLVSFLAVGLARGLDTSVEVPSVDAVDTGHRITFRYEQAAAHSESESASDAESDEADRDSGSVSDGSETET